MYKKIILSILFILISFPVLAEDPLLKEEKVELSLTQFNMVMPASCGPTKDLETVFKKDQIVAQPVDGEYLAKNAWLGGKNMPTFKRKVYDEYSPIDVQEENVDEED